MDRQTSTRPKSLDELRQRIKERDQRVLDLCWSDYKAQGKHLKIREAYFKFERPEVDAAVQRLTGNLIRQAYSSETPGDEFHVTALGVLVSSDGKRLEAMVEHFLRAIKDAYEKNHHIRGMNSDELKPYLDATGEPYTADEVRDLGRVLVLGIRLVDTSAVGPQPNGTWYVNIGEGIDDIRRIRDFAQYIQQEIVKSFDPEEPVSEIERSNRHFARTRVPLTYDELYFGGNQNATEDPPDLSFMRDPVLRGICESDWWDALLANDHGLLKPAVVLCGAVAEGLLLDCLEQGEDSRLAAACKIHNVNRELEEVGLDKLVRVAGELGKIRRPNEHLAHFVREYRNFVHPGRERKEAAQLKEDDVTAALVALRILARDLAETRKREEGT